jgi:N-acetylglucosaminyldiphosphoundecaprenol N-acetyl-beta-D-mannosaminyltransferase
MSAVAKRNILGVLIDDADASTATDLVIDAAHRGGPFSVSAIAVHGVMEGVLDPAHLYRLNSLELLGPEPLALSRAARARLWP